MWQGPKIFGIGFQKTGTTSLFYALKQIDLRVCDMLGGGFNMPRIGSPDLGIKALDWALEAVPRYDAFEDNPWPLLYREMDERFPGSKFILTVRDPQKWIASVKDHFILPSATQAWVYGAAVPAGHEQLYLDVYNRHNEAVKNYFQDRPNDLLVLDISKGNPWEAVAPFLGIETPETPWPRANSKGSLAYFFAKYVGGGYCAAQFHMGRDRIAAWPKRQNIPQPK
jgi:hypothetical protein